MQEYDSYSAGKYELSGGNAERGKAFENFAQVPALPDPVRRAEHTVCRQAEPVIEKQGNPVILYLTADNHIAGPEGGVRQWHTLHWTGKEWVESQFTTSTHDYDSGSLWTDGKYWTVIIPSDPGPQYWGTGGEIVRWISRDQGKTWKRDRNLTRGSRYNHGYVRRPVDAQPDFYAFWADGNPDEVSPSRLYFCTKDGKVFRMPAEMTEEWAKPELIQ